METARERFEHAIENVMCDFDTEGKHPVRDIISTFNTFIIEHDAELLEGVAKEMEYSATHNLPYAPALLDAATLIRSHIPTSKV